MATYQSRVKDEPDREYQGTNHEHGPAAKSYHQTASKKSPESDFECVLYLRSLDLSSSRTRFIIHYSSMETVLFFIVNVRTLNIPYSFSFSNRYSLFIFHFHRRPQHGGSLQCSIILCGTFRRISQLWDNEHTIHFENCPLYSSSIIS